VSDSRLPSGLEAAGLVRSAQAAGDFATILKKGDPDRGALLLVVTSRGRHFGCLERMLSLDGAYSWQQVGPTESLGSAGVAEFLGKKARFDPDLWLIELDIAEPERFIAETIASG
jgi:hypothetical protein